MSLSKYVFFIFLLIFIIPFSSFAQVEEKGEDIEEEQEVFPFCRNKDYLFELDGNFYLDNKKAYICTDNIPAVVTIVDVVNQMPVGTDFKWEVNGDESNHNTNGLVVQNDFNNRGKMKIDVEFTHNGGQQKLTLRMRRNSVEFRESLGRFSFDENEIEQYRGINYIRNEPLGTPWNFILINQTPLNAKEILEGKVKFGNEIDKVNNITSDSDLLDIDPDLFSSRVQNIDFTHAVANINNDYEIEVSCCNGPDLLLYAGRPRSFDVIISRVCESDDDIAALPLGTGNLTPNDVCIESGIDGTIDLMYHPEFLKGNNQLVKNNDNTYSIIAGPAEVQGGSFCRTPILQPDLHCPTELDIDNAVNEMNSLLSKLGLTANVVVNNMNLNVNYDVVDNDNVMRERTRTSNNMPILNENLMATNELSAFIYYRETLENIQPSMMGPVYVFVVPTIKNSKEGTLAGKAYAGFGMHNLIISDKDSKGGRTLLHETGHAKWGFRHPKDPAPELLLGIRGIKKDDKKNFMYFTAEGRTENFRRYQFNIMRNEN